MAPSFIPLSGMYNLCLRDVRWFPSVPSHHNKAVMTIFVNISWDISCKWNYWVKVRHGFEAFDLIMKLLFTKAIIFLSCFQVPLLGIRGLCFKLIFGDLFLKLWGVLRGCRTLIRRSWGPFVWKACCCCSVAQSCPTLWHYGQQHARLPCSSLSSGACSNSCLLSWCCCLTISSSVVPFSSLQSFPASGAFPMSQLFTSGWAKDWSFKPSQLEDDRNCTWDREVSHKIITQFAVFGLPAPYHVSDGASPVLCPKDSFHSSDFWKTLKGSQLPHVSPHIILYPFPPLLATPALHCPTNSALKAPLLSQSSKGH